MCPMTASLVVRMSGTSMFGQDMIGLQYKVHPCITGSGLWFPSINTATQQHALGYKKCPKRCPARTPPPPRAEPFLIWVTVAPVRTRLGATACVDTRGQAPPFARTPGDERDYFGGRAALYCVVTQHMHTHGGFGGRKVGHMADQTEGHKPARNGHAALLCGTSGDSRPCFVGHAGA